MNNNAWTLTQTKENLERVVDSDIGVARPKWCSGLQLMEWMNVN